MDNENWVGGIPRIIDLARWAPSGDNTQPWRFEIISDWHLVVHGFDTRRKVVYDLQGHASQIALGILLETLSIAASEQALGTEFSYRSPLADPDEHPIFDVRFIGDPAVKPDHLLPFLESRCVNRRPLSGPPLTEGEKTSLSHSMNPWKSQYNVLWFEGVSKKFLMANITQRTGKLRLTIPEAYQVHREVIEWNARFSKDRIPDQALGLSLPILPLMSWIMKSWSRVEFFNRFLGGTIIPRIGLDILPALFCSTHFAILAPNPPKSLMNFVHAGRAIGRFWLEATRLGLQFQPEMTPLIFRSFVQEDLSFSRIQGSMKEARKIGSNLDRLIGEGADLAVFLGRIGRGPPPNSRSLRHPVPSLMVDSKQQSGISCDFDHPRS